VPAPPLRAPTLLQLPELYQDLYLELSGRPCVACRRVPDEPTHPVHIKIQAAWDALPAAVTGADGVLHPLAPAPQPLPPPPPTGKTLRALDAARRCMAAHTSSSHPSR
jgi:hypothetical protein